MDALQAIENMEHVHGTCFTLEQKYEITLKMLEDNDIDNYTLWKYYTDKLESNLELTEIQLFDIREHNKEKAVYYKLDTMLVLESVICGYASYSLVDKLTYAKKSFEYRKAIAPHKNDFVLMGNESEKLAIFSHGERISEFIYSYYTEHINTGKETIYVKLSTDTGYMHLYNVKDDYLLDTAYTNVYRDYYNTTYILYRHTEDSLQVSTYNNETEQDVVLYSINGKFDKVKYFNGYLLVKFTDAGYSIYYGDTVVIENCEEIDVDYTNFTYLYIKDNDFYTLYMLNDGILTPIIGSEYVEDLAEYVEDNTNN